MTLPVFASLAALQVGGNQALSMIVMYGLIFAIFYFVLLRPQQKQRKAHDEMVRQLKKGDEVVTAGGLVGEVMHIAPRAADGAPGMEDRVTIKSGEARVIIERGRIARVGASASAA